MRFYYVTFVMFRKMASYIFICVQSTSSFVICQKFSRRIVYLHYRQNTFFSTKIEKEYDHEEPKSRRDRKKMAEQEKERCENAEHGDKTEIVIMDQENSFKEVPPELRNKDSFNTAIGCHPDKEVHTLVVNAFGEWNYATKKIKRMLFWSPKFKHANPYVDWRNIEGKPLTDSELAKWAIRMISRDPGTKIFEWLTRQLPSTSEQTWIVCGISSMQHRLIERHPLNQPLYVDGPFRVYLLDHVLDYFTLTADADPNKFHDVFFEEREETEKDWRDWTTWWTNSNSDRRRYLAVEANMHEQTDGTILALAITGSKSKESTVSWVDFLQKDVIQRLTELTVIFRLRNRSVEIADRPDEKGRKKTTKGIFDDDFEY